MTKRQAHPRSRAVKAQIGAALLAAMLTVTLVATFAAASLWQQWRATEVEAAERARLQSAWVLIGALDWTRLILREDARANAAAGGGADHLAEPWAVPLEEARLASFLSADKNVASDALEGLPDAFLSGRIVDAQSKLNVMNLVDGGKPVAASVAAFTKLFELLGLPAQEVAVLTASLQRAVPASAATAAQAGAATSTGTPVATTGVTGAPNSVTGAPATSPASGSATVPTVASSESGTGPLMPQHVSQLVWLGLSASTAAALEPYVTVLPVRTPLNINTASAEALFASAPALDLASAKRIVAQRTRGYFRSLADASASVQEKSPVFTEGQFSVSTRYFEVFGRLRLDRNWVQEHSLLQRDGLDLKIIWRERGAGATLPPPNS